MPGVSAIGHWLINATYSVVNKNSNVLEPVWCLYSNLATRKIISTSCKPAALLNFRTDFFRYHKKLKQISLEQRVIYLSAIKTDHAVCKNKITVADIPEICVKTDNDSVIRQREINTETRSLNPSVKALDNKSTYQNLSRCQTHWLSIGEKFGAWLVKKKTKP